MEPIVGRMNARGRLRLVPGRNESGLDEGQQRSGDYAGCLCGCGCTPTGREKLFCQGHSILMVELAKRCVRGEVQPDEEQMAYLVESGKLDRARAQVEKEDSSGRRRESQALHPARPRLSRAQWTWLRERF